MIRRLLAVVGLVLVLAGCSGSPSQPTGSQPSGSQPTGSVSSGSESGGTESSGPESGPSAAPASGRQLQTARKRAGIADCPTTDHHAARSDGLPDLTLDCLGSTRQVRLPGLRGTPMVINVWAQWCRPCRLEAPQLSAVARKAGDKIEFVGIDYADPDPAAAIEFAHDAGWHYPQLVDQSQQLKGPLKIIGVPQTFLINAEGRIVYRQVKPLTSDAQLRSLIHDHLGLTL